MDHRHAGGGKFFVRGCPCRYPGGALFSKTFFSVFQCSPASLRICLLLVSSINTMRRISAHSSISVNILHVNPRLPHFSSALYSLIVSILVTIYIAPSLFCAVEEWKWKRAQRANRHLSELPLKPAATA